MEHTHLDHEALLRVSYGAPEAGEGEHAAACTNCAAAVASYHSRHSSLATGNALEELPEAFWQRQRQLILAQIRQPAPLHLRRVAASVALAVALVVALLLTGGSSLRPAKTIPTYYTAEDEKLLRDINLMVNRIEPRALAPATLLLPQEIKEERRP